MGRRREFVIGLTIGAIPLLLALIGLGSLFNVSSQIAGNLLIAGGVGFLVGLVISSFLFVIQTTRRFGAGMLTALLASLIVFFIGCLVILSRSRG